MLGKSHFRSDFQLFPLVSRGHAFTAEEEFPPVQCRDEAKAFFMRETRHPSMKPLRMWFHAVSAHFPHDILDLPLCSIETVADRDENVGGRSASTIAEGAIPRNRTCGVTSMVLVTSLLQPWLACPHSLRTTLTPRKDGPLR